MSFAFTLGEHIHDQLEELSKQPQDDSNLGWDQPSAIHLLRQPTMIIRNGNFLKAQANWHRALAIVKMRLVISNIHEEFAIKQPPPKPSRKEIARKYFLKIIDFISDIILPLTMIYYTIIIPYRAAYNEFTSAWTIWDVTLDFTHILVALVHFINYQREFRKTDQYVVFGKDYHLLLDPSFYRFVLAVAISLPYQLIDNELLVIKILHIIDLGTLTSLTASAAGGLIQSEFVFKLTLWWYPVKIVLLLFIVLHICACFWIWMADSGANPDRWLANWDPGWEVHPADVYIQALMFMAETISTAGYGDTCAMSPPEYVVVSFLQLVSGYFFTQFGAILKYINEKIDEAEMIRQRQKEEMIGWLLQLDRNNQSNIYRHKLTQHLDDFLVEEKGKHKRNLFTENEFYWQLPFNLQFLLAVWYCKKEFVYFQNFFRGLSTDFVQLALLEMIPRRIETGENLFLGPTCDGVYFILKGLVVESHPVTKNIIGHHTQGSVIGLTCVLYGIGSRRIFKAMGDVKVFYIPKHVFNEISWIQKGDRKTLRHKIYRQMKDEGGEDHEHADDIVNQAFEETIKKLTPIMGYSPEQLMDYKALIKKKKEPQVPTEMASILAGTGLEAVKTGASSVATVTAPQRRVNRSSTMMGTTMIQHRDRNRRVVPLNLQGRNTGGRGGRGTEVVPLNLKDNSSAPPLDSREEVPSTDRVSLSNVPTDRNSLIRDLEELSKLDVTETKLENSPRQNLGASLRQYDHLPSEQGSSNDVSTGNVNPGIISTAIMGSITSVRLETKKEPPKKIVSTFANKAFSFLKGKSNKVHVEEKIVERKEEEERDDFDVANFDPDKEEKEHDNADDDGSDDEEDLDSSLEVPTEGLAADEIADNPTFFTIDQICVNLETKLKLIEKRLHHQKDEIRRELWKCRDAARSVRGVVAVKALIAESQTFTNMVSGYLKKLL